MFQDTTPFVLALVITFTVLICISIWNNIKSPAPQIKSSAPEPGPSRTREILSRFSEFYLNLDPQENFLYDVAILPDPKQHIIHALYVGYDESETEEDKQAIIRGLKAIANFQQLIGDEPIGPPSIIQEDEDVSPQNLFLNTNDLENEMSEEEKKYNNLIEKRDTEINEYFEHLKIEIEQDSQNEEQL